MARGLPIFEEVPAIPDRFQEASLYPHLKSFMAPLSRDHDAPLLGEGHAPTRRSMRPAERRPGLHCRRPVHCIINTNVGRAGNERVRQPEDGADAPVIRDY